MASIHFKDGTVHSAADLPTTGTKAPDFVLTKTDLSDVSLKDFAGKNIIFNIFPSIDTGVCATSVRRFNQLASGMNNAVVVCVSKDLPFAHKRFCGAEGIENVVMTSQYKNNSFSAAYGVDMIDGALVGLMSRAIVVVGADGTVKYTEQVPDIGQEPDYQKALDAVMHG